MKLVLEKLRKHKRLYEKIKIVYGKTIGVWWLKGWYAKNVGFYNGKKRLKLLGNYEGDRIVSEKIKSGRPFMMSRYGSTEFRNLFSENDLDLLCCYSGFFPNDKKLLNEFRKIYIKSSKFIDVLVVWNYKNHFINKIKLMKTLPNIEYIVPLFVVGPFNCSWVKELENKKVLVIHPFKKTIERQFGKRANLGILPKLKSFQVIRAVQTLANNKDKRFKTWFDALNFMKKEIDEKDFDIVLIGCGAYGLPLAAYVKSIGKQALHVGGGLQLFFGIKGKRWDKYDAIKYNKYWVSPMKEDFLKNYDKIEGGCYW